MTTRFRSGILFLGLALVTTLMARPAWGSVIIDRNVSRPALTIDRHGRAHVSYYRGGQKKLVIAWGAINARAPSQTRPQVTFRIRYGVGGKGVCLPYDGPPLAWLVKACKAPDGSYWALQRWQRLKQNYGGDQGAWELHLSHWRGPLPRLVVYENWVDVRYRHFFGKLSYRGQGVHGFKATGTGSPLDSYGRNVYVDTFDSAYGQGWHRENGFLTHRSGKTPGDFCYTFFPHSGHPSGQGTKYRATVEGPGVTPDVMWANRDIGPFDLNVQDGMDALERSWGDPKCQP